MVETKTNDYLEKERLGKLMWKYSIPCVISMLVAALYNIVDQIFIANAAYLGSYGNAANTVVFPMTVVAIAIAVMIGDGCCTFVSISLGAKEQDNASRGIGSSVIAVIAVSIILMIIYLVFQEPILNAFGARVNEETFQLSKEYFFWITLGIPFYMFGQALNPIIRSDGSPRFAMMTLLIGAVLNIILDPICIYVLHWGMAGAAIATIIGQILSAILSAAYLFQMKAVKMDKDCFIFRPKLVQKILVFGSASFLAQISIVLSMAATLNMAVKYGAMDAIFGQPEYSHIPTAVVGIVMKFFQIVISIAAGLAAGCIPIAGYNIGAKRNDRVLSLMKRLMTVEVLVGLVASVIFLVFPNQIIKFFGSENESIYYTEFAVWYIRTHLCLLALACLNKGTFIFLQSLGRAKESSALSITREIIFGAGLPILLPMFWGLYALPCFMPVADTLTFIAAAVVLYRTKKSLEMSCQTDTDTETSVRFEPSSGEILTSTIITLGRSYGSGGRSVGRLLAERLHIPYYDAALLEEAANHSGISQKFLAAMDEKPLPTNMLYQYIGFHSSDYHSFQKLANQAQREVIESVAKQGPCIIVGRRADQILKEYPNVLKVFITAPKQSRIQRIAERDCLSESESAEKLAAVDKERAVYYNQYSDKRWGSADSYDLCIDTEQLGIEGAVDTIMAAIAAIER